MPDFKYPEHRDPQRQPRYLGLPTFMRAPHTTDLDAVDIGLIGVPFDGGVTNRPGARHGPREIRNQSSLIRKVNQATGINPWELAAVADIGDAWAEKPYELEAAQREIQAFFEELAAAGVVPLTAGGDHSISLPILRVLGREEPVGMVQFDAHCDTGDDYLGSRFHHGAPFRRAVEEGVLDPARTIQIGIRGSLATNDFWQFSSDSGMRVVLMEELVERGPEKILKEARQIAGDKPTYISFDIDGLDPAFAPGTGTPEIGGINTIDAQHMLRGLEGLHLVGADVVEVAPPFDVGGLTAMTAATLMFEILCVIAPSVAARRG